MSDPADTQRLIGDVARLGTIASVDHGTATCTVTVGDITTGALPWVSGRAGATRIWSPPSAGEQVMLICPEGDTAAGIVLPGLFSDASPAPGNSAAELIHFADGAIIGYDPDAHRLTAILPGGGTASIEASGGIRLVGDVTIEGGLTASGDVTAKGISLASHTHSGVQAGGAKTGAPA